MPDLPGWYPWRELEVKAAPMPLLRVQGFLNTMDFETGDDVLAKSNSASPWASDAGLIAPEQTVSASELELARSLRESLRGNLAPLRQLTGQHHAQLVVNDEGTLALKSSQDGHLADGLFDLLLIIRAAQEDGSWARLRICANDGCRWAFYDRSRNYKGQWCDMAGCGNRLNNRHFRARQRA
jgi:hypothetical protein